MVGYPVVGNDLIEPPVHIFDRLRKIPNYAWDEARPPFHSSYDNWYMPPSHLMPI